MIIELGPVPAEEDCIQVDPNRIYLPQMRAECNRYRTMLEQRFPDLPPGISFIIKTNSHDFGTYLEVAVKTDDSDSADSAALLVEEYAPITWDDQEIFPMKGLFEL